MVTFSLILGWCPICIEVVHLLNKAGQQDDSQVDAVALNLYHNLIENN